MKNQELALGIYKEINEKLQPVKIDYEWNIE